MTARWKLILHGRVQNIGFRYRAYILARDFPITGWVANLDDGTVELVLQGEPADMDSFFQKLRRLPGVHISQAERENLSVIAEKRFRIKN